MKKLAILLLIVTMAFAIIAFSACGKKPSNSASGSSSGFISRSKQPISTSKSTPDSNTQSSEGTPSVSDSVSDSVSAPDSSSTPDSSSIPESSSTPATPVEVTDLISSISALGEVTFSNYTDKKTDLEAAEAAYTALSTENQALVTNYETLTAARTAYDSALAAQPLVDAFKEDVVAIGTVTFTSECKTLIDVADASYLDIPEAYRSFVSTEKTTLDQIHLDYEAAEITANIAAFKAAVTDIGTVEFTAACKQKIDTAVAAYATIPTERQSEVATEKATLDAAIADYNNAKPAEVKAVIAEIDAIGEITSANYTTKKTAIETAETNYAALSPEYKEYVSNYDTLTTARRDYNAFVVEENRIQGLITVFKDAVTAIGTVEYTPECKALIQAAETAYAAIPTERQSDVATEKATLDQANTDYTNAGIQILINNFVSKVEQIGEVTYTTACDNLIGAAETAYAEIPTEKQSDVAVTTAKATLDAKRAAYIEAGIQQKITTFTTKVGEIDEIVTLEDACKLKIEAAESAYAEIPAERQSDDAVTTAKATLDAKRAAYNTLADQAAVTDFITKVGVIDVTVEITQAYKDNLDAADAAYALVPTSKLEVAEVVSAKSTLDAKKAEYVDKVAVNTFMTAYNALPTSGITVANKAQFQAVIDSYDGLTTTQKALVAADVVTAIEGFRTTVSSMKESTVIDFNNFGTTVAKNDDSKRTYFTKDGYSTTVTNFYIIKGSGSFKAQDISSVIFAGSSLPSTYFGVFSTNLSKFETHLTLEKASTVKIFYSLASSAGSSSITWISATNGFAYTGTGTAVNGTSRVATAGEITTGTANVAVIEQHVQAGEAVFNLAKNSRVAIFKIVITED